MSAVKARRVPRVIGHPRSARGIFATARFWIYLACIALAVLASYLLGKEMMWDTLDYHFYAGFSALHDRLGRDYFAAGVQAYLNPYVYVPFYALTMTGLPALWIASVLAVVQSGILWLTYELAVALSPVGNVRLRVAAGACAALFALANPILINQLGSSYADITTAEIVLAGWLLLVHALRTPNAWRIVTAGVLLGAASALKLTNSVHALSACVLLLFLPTDWRRKTKLSIGFSATLAVSFAAVAGPWAVHLRQYFGNPFFPLLNNIFRSPNLPAVVFADYRFVPSSLGEALVRPFAITLPVTYVDENPSSPDIRYAVLLALALIAAAAWGWRKWRRPSESNAASQGASPTRGLVALACAFSVDWTLWLRASGNGRYFLAMACVAGVLAMVLAFRIFGARRQLLAFLLVAIFVIQGVQLVFGTEYRTSAAWDGGPWLEVSVPAELKKVPTLYFLLGYNSESFVAPFLAKNSAFVNLAGDYVLGPEGPNGTRIRSLIHEYAPHIRVVTIADDFQHAPPGQLPELLHVDYTLASFGLRADTGDCSAITVRDIRTPSKKMRLEKLSTGVSHMKSGLFWVPQSRDGYLVACQVVPNPGSSAALANAEREPNLVLDRMEDACPRLFQPPRPVTNVFSDGHGGYVWTRAYASTNLEALLSNGSLRLVDGTRGGEPDELGSEDDWAKAPLRLVCGRRGERYYATVTSASR